MVSEKQIIANIENAKKSTGPKNTELTKFNSLKHGILAKSIIIKGVGCKENENEFMFILECLRNDIKPRNTLEDIATENISIKYWRLRRVINAENGHLKDKLDNMTEDVMRSSMLNKRLFSKEGIVKDELSNRMNTASLMRQIPNIDFMDAMSRYETSLERSILRNLEIIEKSRKLKF